MGTSTNQGSPRTPNWRAAQLAYESRDIPLDRALQEIWRAATNQEEGNIAFGLSSPIVARCLEIVSSEGSRDAALAKASSAIALSGEASLASTIAERAVALSFARGDRVTSFLASLFAEATNYLVSRDLPGFVGAGGRAENVSQALAFKSSLRQRAAEVVAGVRGPEPHGSRQWKTYVDRVIAQLRSIAPNQE